MTFDEDFVRMNSEFFQNANPDLVKDILKEKCPIASNTCKFVSWQERDKEKIEFTIAFSDNFSFFINYYIFNLNQELLGSFLVYYEGGDDFNIQSVYGTFQTNNLYQSITLNKVFNNETNIEKIDSIIKTNEIQSTGKTIEKELGKYNYERNLN